MNKPERDSETDHTQINAPKCCNFLHLLMQGIQSLPEGEFHLTCISSKLGALDLATSSFGRIEGKEQPDTSKELLEDAVTGSTVKDAREQQSKSRKRGATGDRLQGIRNDI